jgi:V-type H+-transporting ATPase subunit e
MTNSDNIMIGTLCYGVLFFVMAIPISSYVGRHTLDDRQKGDNRSLTWVLCGIATFCMWLMWLCSYMHQMYPLVTPDI